MSAPTSPDERSASAEALEHEARQLLPIVQQQARRPYIVELAGTPKAGKTTALHILHRFFKQCGYQVQQVHERAADCPIGMKGHFFFNTWTTTTMIASMIENLDTEADLLLLDRGVFDSIVWLEAQSLDQQVSEEERQIFRDFALLERWRSLTDLTCVLTVSPRIAMQRENADLLLPRDGSIMSPDSLTRYNEVLAKVRGEVAELFNFIDIDTTDHDSPRQTNHEIAAALVRQMREWVDPPIAAIPRPVAAELFASDGVRDVSDTIDTLQEHLVVRRRSSLESDSGFVQLVSAVVLRHRGDVLLLRRTGERDEEKIKTHGEYLLWKGCHIPCADANSSNLLDMASEAIKLRLREDFHLARFGSEPVPRALVWNDDPSEARHLGVLFDLEITDPVVGESLIGKVFKRARNRTKLKSKFISPEDLHRQVQGERGISLESWSRQLLAFMLSR